MTQDFKVAAEDTLHAGGWLTSLYEVQRVEVEAYRACMQGL